MTRIASGRPAPRYGQLGTLLVTTEKATVGVERSQLLLVSSAEMDHSAISDYRKEFRQRRDRR